jgi:hypothetical protein
MVLSLLPMNVFGARGTVVPIEQNLTHRTGANDAPPNHNDPRRFTVGINANDLSNLPTTGAALYLEFVLTNGGTAVNANDEVSSRPVGSDRTRAGNNVLLSLAERFPGSMTIAEYNANRRAWFETTASFRPGLTEDDLTAATASNNFATPEAFADHLFDTLNDVTGHEEWNNRRFIVPLQGLLAAYHDEGQWSTPTLDGTITVALDLIARHREGNLTINVVERRGASLVPIRVLVNSPLLLVDRIQGVTFDTPGAVPFSNHAQLPPVRIEERTPGELTAGAPGTGITSPFLTVRLEAQRGFRWDAVAINQLGAQGLRVTGQTAVFAGATVDPSGGRAGIPGVQFTLAFDPVTQIDTLYVHIPAAGLSRQGTTIAETTLGRLDIHGLVLIAGTGAPTTGNVVVNAQIGTARDNIYRATAWVREAAPPSLATPTPQIALTRFGVQPSSANGVGIEFARDTGNALRLDETDAAPWGGDRATWAWGPNARSNRSHANWAHDNLVVAIMGIEGVIEVEGPADIVTVTSGQVPFYNRVGGDDPTWLTRRAHTVRLTETVTSTMLRTIETYEFRFVQPGVRFVDAQMRIGDTAETNRGPSPAVGTAYNQVPAIANTQGTGGWIDGNGGNWTSMLNQVVSGQFSPHIIPGGSSLEPDVVRIMPRPLAAESNQRRRIMDVRFQISVEAGFAARYGSEIEVAVYRNGVFIDTVVIAEVVDMIELLPVTPVELVREQLDIIAITPVPNFTIRELEPNTLGTWGGGLPANEIWIYLQTIQNGMPIELGWGNLELVITNPPTINTQESGFTLRQVTGLGGSLTVERAGRQVVAFEVIRPSNVTVPAEITFTGVHVTGSVVPNVEYHVVVGGPAVARNAAGTGVNFIEPQHVIVELPATDNPRGANRAGGDIRFGGIPYSAPLLVVTGHVHVEGPDPNQPVRPTFEPFTLTQGQAIFSPSINDMIDPAVINHEGTTMIAFRAFGDKINADVINWNPVTRQVTMSAIAANGNRMTVVLTIDSNQAIITDSSIGIPIEVDIASWIISQNPELAAAGISPMTIRPIIVGVRTYLPARFLAYVFGFDVNWNAATLTATFTPRG